MVSELSQTVSSGLKIIDVKATPVTVPMEAPLRWSLGVETGTTRTIIKLYTDRGIIGIGETYGGRGTVEAINAAKPLFIGSDPFELGRLIDKFQTFRISYEFNIPIYVLAGIEMACWDIIGKYLDKPLYSVLGGATKKEVPFIAYLFYRYRSDDGKGGESTPDDLLNYYDQLCSRYGCKFVGVKLKTGVFDPLEELKAVKAFRESFGENFLIRFDPNGAWSVETSIRILKQMEKYDVEYVEDPTYTLEGMSLVRKSVDIPLGTNMCVINFEQIPLAVRMHAIDMVGLDIHYWGGFTLCKKLVGVAETFQLGIYVHSDRELGVSTAAILHFVASHPYIVHAVDSHYHYQIGDVVTEEFAYKKGGVMKVPDGPGLGVEIDDKKLEKWHEYYKSHGEVIEFLDPKRPDWIPTLPLW